MKYTKYHALGNDYLVLNPLDFESVDFDSKTAPRFISLVCHRNYGVGSDGILLGPLPSRTCDFRLRIFNPDGSEAEKSGNGIRIFSRYLWDRTMVGGREFTLETAGGPVASRVLENARIIRVEMGQVSFDSQKIPVAGPRREVINEPLQLDGRRFTFCAATVGNPHCVIPSETVSSAETKNWGPRIETAPFFPNRTNVQFMQVIDRGNIRIEIWERGAGYTLASGSSSTAAAAVARKLGLCDPRIAVHMPGGTLHIELADDFRATLTGPVTRVCEGRIDKEIFETGRNPLYDTGNEKQ